MIRDTNSAVVANLIDFTHDASKPYGGDMAAALGRVRATALIVASSSDRVIYPDLTAELITHLPKVNHLRIETDKGHLATSQPEGTPEWLATNARTREFLARLSAAE